MPEDHPEYDDKIYLNALFKVLWDSKWLITAFTVITIFVGSGYVAFQDKVYQSNLFYSINNIPPFYDDSRCLNDFKKLFYSKNIFEDWKKSYGKTILSFEDFKETKTVDNIILKRSNDGRLASFVNIKKEMKTAVAVYTDNLVILNDFYNYLNFINKIMRANYQKRAISELEIINIRFKELALVDSSIAESYLEIDRYIAEDYNVDVLSIQRPTFPIKISPLTKIIITLSGFLGLMIGVAFTIMRNYIRKFKEYQA